MRRAKQNPGIFLVGMTILILAPIALKAGDFGHCQSAATIIEVLAKVDPDNLTPAGENVLLCLDISVDGRLFCRYPDHLPSWQILRNIRREYRNLGRNPEVVKALERITISRDERTRNMVSIALAIEAWRFKPDNIWKARLLDALYYQSTAEAIAFIESIVKGDGSELLKRRARWMLRNPMPVADSWKL